MGHSLAAIGLAWLLMTLAFATLANRAVGPRRRERGGTGRGPRRRSRRSAAAPDPSAGESRAP